MGIPIIRDQLMLSALHTQNTDELKASDRGDTLKMFRGSSYELIQVLKTGEPEDAARYLVAKAKEAKNDDTSLEAATLIMISLI